MKAQRVFRIVRNAGLTLLAVWIVIWAYFYFSHSSMFWERERTTKSVKSAGMPREKATAAAEQARPKEPPFYQPGSQLPPINPGTPPGGSYGFDEGYGLPALEGDGIEGVVEKIEGRVLTIKLDHMRCDDSGREVKPGMSGYSTAHKSVKVEIPEDFTTASFMLEYARLNKRITFVNFEDIQVGQRIDIEWAKKAGSQDPLKIVGISRLP